MKPIEILEIEKYYDLKLINLIEDERIESKVEFYKNKNTFSTDSNNQVLKINLADNNLKDLVGLNKVGKTITHLNLGSNHIKSIEVLKNFKNLIYLDLSTNEIEEFSPISKLNKLEFLYLDNNKIKIIPKLEMPRLYELWLYSNQISNIENLKSLKELIFLNISKNKISDIKGLSELKNLKDINLNNNNISDISQIENFYILDTLDLSSNKIIDIKPLSNFAIIGSLHLDDNLIEDTTSLSSIQIGELFIGENNIVDLTPLYDSFKTNKIQFINVHNSPNLLYPTEEIAKKGGEYGIVKWFDMIFDNIEKCKQKIINARDSGKTKLDIGMMGLTDLTLIPNLFELEDLEELILSNVWAEFNTEKNEWEPKFSENEFYRNNIISIPNDIIKLKKLKKLLIGGDWKKGDKWNRWRIKDISFINKLDNIEFINLSNNSIDTFKITRNLNFLETIHLNNNYIKNISISKATNLKYLFVSNNQIENLNFLKKSLKLIAIDLHSNKIKDLYPIRELIIRLGIINDQWKYDTISIAKNNLENPGMEVVDRGKEAALRIMKSNYGNKNTFKNDELKLILVGNSETGKTTLAKYLANDIKYKSRHPLLYGWIS